MLISFMIELLILLLVNGTVEIGLFCWLLMFAAYIVLWVWPVLAVW